MRRYRYLAAVASMTAACVTKGIEPIDLLLTNGRVVVDTATVLDRASILIDGGIILDVRQGEPPNVAATRTIDVAGRTVLPGLIDTHVHLLVGDGNPGGQLMPRSEAALAAYQANTLPARLRSYLARGITTVLSTGDYFPAILALREQTARDPQLGPRVLTVGPVVSAKDGHPAATICDGNAWCRTHLSREIETLADVERVLRELATARVDAVKVVHDAGLNSALTTELLAAVIGGARDRGLAVMVHAGSVREATEAIAAGADQFVHPPATDQRGAEMLAIALKEKGRMVSSTLAISAISDEWESAQGRPARYLPNAAINFGHFIRGNVALAFGTDAPMLDVAAAMDLEFKLLEGSALKPRAIIQMLTKNAAAFIGDTTIGTIAGGKRADLLIVDGAPLSSLAALRNVHLVLRDGQVVYSQRR